MFVAFALLVPLFSGWHGVEAGTIFSTLGPGDTYGPSGGTIAGASAVYFGNPVHQQAVGSAFTPTSNATVSEIELAAGILSGTNSLNVQLRNDDGTGKPGSIIESFQVNNLPTFDSFGSDHLLTALSSLTPSLSAGTQYWLTAFPGAADTLGALYAASTGQIGTAADSLDGGATWIIGSGFFAFRIDGSVSAVPEPASLIPFGIGIVSLLGYGWRRRKRGLAA